MDLMKLFDENFIDKGEEYTNLLFFIYRQQSKNIFKEEIKVKLFENFFKNKFLLKKSKIFLSELLKELKPEVFTLENNRGVSKQLLLDNFLNLKINKFNR